MSYIQYEVDGKLWERVVEPCDRCGGAGYSDIYSWKVNGGTCFKCGGSGKQVVERRVLTEKEKEQRAKAKIRRDEKARLADELKRAETFAKRNEDFKKEKFFGVDTLYAVTLDNTYNIRETLKEQGARWSGSFQRWCFTVEQEQYPTVTVKFEDVTFTNEFDTYEMIDKCADVVSKMIRSGAEEVVSKHIGSVGERMSFEVTVKGWSSYDTQFGTSYIYRMVDVDGNAVVWFTSNCDLDTDSTYTMMAKIKEHGEYNGVAQTVITRPTKIVQK